MNTRYINTSTEENFHNSEMNLKMEDNYRKSTRSRGCEKGGEFTRRHNMMLHPGVTGEWESGHCKPNTRQSTCRQGSNFNEGHNRKVSLKAIGERQCSTSTQPNEHMTIYLRRSGLYIWTRNNQNTGLPPIPIPKRQSVRGKTEPCLNGLRDCGAWKM